MNDENSPEEEIPWSPKTIGHEELFAHFDRLIESNRLSEEEKALILEGIKQIFSKERND